MPHKYAQSKGWNVPKQKHKLTNWSEYNNSLKNPVILSELIILYVFLFYIGK